MRLTVGDLARADALSPADLRPGRRARRARPHGDLRGQHGRRPHVDVEPRHGRSSSRGSFPGASRALRHEYPVSRASSARCAPRAGGRRRLRLEHVRLAGRRSPGAVRGACRTSCWSRPMSAGQRPGWRAGGQGRGRAADRGRRCGCPGRRARSRASRCSRAAPSPSGSRSSPTRSTSRVRGRADQLRRRRDELRAGAGLARGRRGAVGRSPGSRREGARHARPGGAAAGDRASCSCSWARARSATALEGLAAARRRSTFLPDLPWE